MSGMSQELQKMTVFADSEELALDLESRCAKLGHEVIYARTLEQLKGLLENGEWGVVVLGLLRPRDEGLALVEELVSGYPEPDVLVVTRDGLGYRFSEAIHAGASEFLVLPVEHDELEAKIARVARERRLRKKLKKLSVEDSLTGLFNRRMLDITLHKELHRASRQGYRLFLIFLDVDQFKTYNDLYGHLEGDHLLRALAEVLRQNIREHVDMAYRYGGDEFAVSITHTTSSQALMIAERIRKSFNRLNLPPTSLSIGVAEAAPHPEGYVKAAEYLLKRADLALFKAKREGGDRIVKDEAA